MKLLIYFLLLAAAATVAPAVIRTTRSQGQKTEDLIESLIKNGEPPADLLPELDKSVDKLESYLPKIRELRPEFRDVTEKIALIVVDFEQPADYRIKMINFILQTADLTEEEEKTFRESAIMTIVVTEPVARKIPLAGKELGTMLVKMMLSDDFLFGTRATRRTMVWRMGRQFAYKMKLNPDLAKESKIMQIEKEVENIKKAIGILDF